MKSVINKSVGIKELIKKRIAVILCLGISFILFTGFGTMPGIGNVVYDPATEVAPGISYQEQIAVNPIRGLEHAYEIEANIVDGDITPYVYTGSITSVYKLSSMISSITAEGYNVIAGVNGDFFSTNDNTTLGLNIHNGYIYSSGSNESTALAFKSDGSAFLAGYKFTIPMSVDHTNYIENDTGQVDEGGNPIYETVEKKEDLNINISFINESMGSGNSIHYFNNRYGAATKTKMDCVEVVVNTNGTADPSFNGTITGTIASVNTNVCSTAIGSNQFVLSVAMTSEKAALLSKLNVRESVSVSVVNDMPDYQWESVKEAIGAHDVIAQNGVRVTSSTSSAPRTCIGIKEDGNIMMYAVDGRQSTYSNGLSMTDVADYMLSRGCVDVINFDGGGSTTFAVRMPGDTKAGVVNSPSDGSQRSVSNGLFLVTKSSSSGTAANLTVYPRQRYVLAGSSIQMSVKATDELFMPASLPGAVTYTLNDDQSGISSTGMFHARSSARNVTVTAETGGISSTAMIRVVDNATYSLNYSSLAVDPGSTKDVNVKSASYMYNNVTFDDGCFKWSCDPDIGTISNNGVFSATDSKFAKGNIYVALGWATKTIPVQVGTLESFSDISGNWASKYIISLSDAGVISGMGDGTFAPGANVTRAQFVKLLSGAVGVTEFSGVSSAGFTDVPADMWYAPYVNWAANSGIVSGMGDGTFSPNATITREQMAVMLSNLGSAADVIFEPVTENKEFNDATSISDWAAEDISIIVTAGIMNGKPYETTAGTIVTIFDPQGNATRAESAKVIYLIRELLK